MRVAAQEAARAGAPVLPPPPPPADGRLRIAYLSSDFGDYPVGRLVASLPELHAAGSAVVPLLFPLVPPDGSEWRNRTEAFAAKVVPAGGLSNADIAAAISSDDSHILVDLMGFTAASFAMTRESVLARRPAPITVALLGFPGTSGDRRGQTGQTGAFYTVADRVVAPPSGWAALFSERLLILPHSYQLNEASATPKDNQFKVLQKFLFGHATNFPFFYPSL